MSDQKIGNVFMSQAVQINHRYSRNNFGDNAGLIVAEVELEVENESFAVPDWAGADVTHDPRYYNVNLVKHPFKNW